MKKALAAIMAVVALAGVAQSAIVVNNNRDNVTAGTQTVTRSSNINEGNYWLSILQTTGDATGVSYGFGGVDTNTAINYTEAEMGTVVAAGTLNTATGGTAYRLLFVTNTLATQVTSSMSWTGTGNGTFSNLRIRTDAVGQFLVWSHTNSVALTGGSPAQNTVYDWTGYGAAAGQALVVDAWTSTNSIAYAYSATGGSISNLVSQAPTRDGRLIWYDNAQTAALTTTLGTSPNGGGAELLGFGFVEIPEPATVGMLGLGALVTLVVRRFKRG